MFGLFKKKSYKPSVTPADKKWIEENFIWLISAFGIDQQRTQPFLPPTIEQFPYHDLKDEEQFHQLFTQFCGNWDVKPEEIRIKFFDDIRSKQWTEMVPHGSFDDAGGVYQQLYTTTEPRFQIRLAKSNLDQPQLMVYVLSHELAHVKLLGDNAISADDGDMEPLTDLTCIYFRFGIFVANSCQNRDINWLARSGYLPNEVIAYANALMCYITGREAKEFEHLLNQNTRQIFRNDFEFLINTHDTMLTSHKVFELESDYILWQKCAEGFKSKNFDAVIESATTFLKKDPRDSYARNNIGYALLLQKKYREAIDQFTMAIDINPYSEYPINNRGYCLLQLGDLENAHIDLQASFEMNPHNSYSWRNLGAYYLHLEDFTKALEYFEHAEKIDPHTEMINFYLAFVHFKLGNEAKFKEYRDKSERLNEHNDSMFSLQ